MALDVYFQQDIRRNIVAVAVAMLSTAAAHGVTNVEYCRGVLDTSRAQALNHGMPWAEILGDLREALGDAERGELLLSWLQVTTGAVLVGDEKARIG